MTLRKSRPRRRLTLSENIVSPLVRYACDLRGEGQSRILLSRNAHNALRASLRRRLTFPLKSIVRFEWELFLNNPRPAAKANVEDQLADPYELYFADGIERVTLALAELYPELRRIWCAQIRNWLAFFETFRLHAARFAKRMNFGDDVRIVRLRPDISDPHQGNRTVIRVSFESGGDWIYKPRCAGHGKTWFKLLSQINEKGFSHPFRIPRLISVGKHYWMEAIRARRCATRQQEQDFWFRCGALLCLVDTLHGVDFHAGNLLCAEDQPVFVDCETLGHPETAMPREAAAREKGLFRTGMLPPDGVALRDTVAGLGLMTVERVSVKRRATVDRAEVVAAGFENMHHFMTREFDGLALLVWVQNRMRKHYSRILYRPTAQYHLILEHSLSVDLLRNTATRLGFLTKVCYAPHIPDDISANEAIALIDLDVPYFVGPAAVKSKLSTTASVKRATNEILNALRRGDQGCYAASSVMKSNNGSA